MNYYSDNDPHAAAWIEELIAAGEIADGVVDDRDVQLLGPDDHLERYDQCHFFAGISGWAHALDLDGGTGYSVSSGAGAEVESAGDSGTK